MLRLIATSMFVCGFCLEAQSQSAITSPTPTGRYAVGRKQITWTDSARRDPVDTTRFREVTGWIWYPARKSSHDSVEHSLPGDWQSKRLESLRVKFGPDLATAMQSFTVRSHTNAPLARGDKRFPVVLFIPGLSWLASDYSVLVEDLASNGYIVVGISPTGFSDPVMFPDGRVIPRTLGMGEKIGTEQSYVHDDAAFALRQIERLDAGFFHGRVDLAHIGAFGHSLGGTAALVLANHEPTVRAAINIDGDAMGVVREVRPAQPLLLISSESPTIDEAPQNTAAHMELVRAGLERSEQRRTGEWNDISSKSIFARRIRVLGTHHLNFEDAALGSGVLTTRESRWMKFGSVDPREALVTLNRIVRTFFDKAFAPQQTTKTLSDSSLEFAGTRLESAGR
ncbi:MAG TPA: hypothetical protein VF042_09920 [Gemmatimonadaceae bacterium]